MNLHDEEIFMSDTARKKQGLEYSELWIRKFSFKNNEKKHFQAFQYPFFKLEQQRKRNNSRGNSSMSKHMLSAITNHSVQMDRDEREVSRSLGSYANKVFF